jgi:hypothetical protein
VLVVCAADPLPREGWATLVGVLGEGAALRFASESASLRRADRELGLATAASAGHSVAVLLKVYAHRLGGQADTDNKRITDALGGTESIG